MKIVKRDKNFSDNYGISREKERAFFFKNYKKGDRLNVTETAKSLGVSRRTIYNWINEINNQ